jgi:maltodextrin utilization protein YvdJ
MDKVIERGQKIEVLVKKSEMMSDQSIDMHSTASRVKNKMWWKNKKAIIAIIGVVVVVIIIIIILIVAMR